MLEHVIIRAVMIVLYISVQEPYSLFKQGFSIMDNLVSLCQIISKSTHMDEHN